MGEVDGHVTYDQYLRAETAEGSCQKWRTLIHGRISNLHTGIVSSITCALEIALLNCCLMMSGNIPDPTLDLGWSDFRGAIHDIFDVNARKQPNSVCVIETASDATPSRSFSYQQINEASNILAHHLIANDIQRGDVVMIYAYRGVDLVIAVMGVLKAGATFSVIDPAYPPERQQIYLEVAQPRALINIEKAMIEAGHLSQIVRTYIDTELHMKTEIPSLCIDNGGELSGGLVDGQDVFDLQKGRASESPHVLVGPDSNPTLSFTSGSEGRPKGVLGRHFSLAYYFPWMAERFELNQSDRFSMLSGIAHDPIQRDIFTPLFLGAQLLVPSKEDIRHEKLAEWMQRYDITVTHLTPAMGQILVGGASAHFPYLKRAFFVGDILTKRDCNLLRKLALNANIVNMYGTTETQRAVSYFEIPSKKREPCFLDGMMDIIPAGQGMFNVQLLVVDLSDITKQCTVGQTGEIYVRAGGLAEGYLGDTSLNEKKFLQNWFVDPLQWEDQDKRQVQSQGSKEQWRAFYKGPRDRLYRTGDLGRYLPSGDVECIGRADDQVKIRGFRIELGDINTYLSQHHLIRDCVTLVRRNKDEEPTLVSYIVPELTRWPQWLATNGLQDSMLDNSMVGMIRRFRPLQDDVRIHLKAKLPLYAIPTHFVPLLKFPLNPNGKIDKPALPFPDIADITAAAPQESVKVWESLSATEQDIATIWADLISGCNAMTIAPEDSFFDLGGHSILAQQMLLVMKSKLHYSQPSMASLFSNPTLRGFSAAMDHASDLQKAQANNGLMANGKAEAGSIIKHNYADDARQLIAELPSIFPSSEEIDTTRALTVFLTGASGYLGAYIIRDLLNRVSPSVSIVAHVRAKSSEAALLRLQNSCTAYGVWSSSWYSRITCVTGNLGEPKLGLEPKTWSDMAEKIDIVIHNGAQVHWVYPYSKLKPANVQGTIDALDLCATGRPKNFTFVSSTSVLDNDYYIQKSKKSLEQGGSGISEADDLEGSSTGLGTGYGQTKWVSEYLVREAGRRGLRGTIVRPGYVLGDSNTGGMLPQIQLYL